MSEPTALGRAFAPITPRLLVATLATAVLYVASAKLGLSLAFIAEQVSAVWPPTGIALAAVLLLRREAIPGIALGAFLANATAHEPLATAAGVALGNTLEAVVGAWLLERVGFRPALDRVRDVLALVVLGAAASTMVSATIGVTSLCLGDVQPWSKFGSLWAVWWLGDALGNLVVAPLLLVWISSPPRRWSGARGVEAAALLGGVIAVSVAVFGTPYPSSIAHKLLPYQLFPVIVWSALRFRQIGATTATFIAATLAIWSTLQGRGPFMFETTHASLLMLQLFEAIVAITGVVLAAAISERDSALVQAGTEYERLSISEERLRLALEAGHALQGELRARADELAQADQRKDEFLAMLAHELRNPLAPLSNALHLLRIRGGDRERFLEMAERQVGLLARLVDDLLDVSRITQGKIALRKAPVLLAEAVEQAVETVRSQIESRAQTLTLSLPLQPVQVEADQARLAQVFANLLDNAAKYTAPGGSIWLTAEPIDSDVIVRVRDTGVGLGPELLPHVFDLFVQADVSLERARGGLGIGLTIVRRLVELHGGSVEAHSGGLGRGSEFVVRLPRASPAASGAWARSAPQISNARPLRVLIVEDNKDSAETLASILELWGHETRLCFDGLGAVAAVEAFEPDVVLSDIGLPGMNGFEVARLLREHPVFGKVVLVAMSGYGRDEDKRRAIDAGFDHHLVKPPDLPALAELLGRVARTGADHSARTVH